jgi:hypothetical protein
MQTASGRQKTAEVSAAAHAARGTGCPTLDNVMTTPRRRNTPLTDQSVR